MSRNILHIDCKASIFVYKIISNTEGGISYASKPIFAQERLVQKWDETIEKFDLLSSFDIKRGQGETKVRHSALVDTIDDTDELIGESFEYW